MAIDIRTLILRSAEPMVISLSADRGCNGRGLPSRSAISSGRRRLQSGIRVLAPFGGAGNSRLRRAPTFVYAMIKIYPVLEDRS